MMSEDLYEGKPKISIDDRLTIWKNTGGLVLFNGHA